MNQTFATTQKTLEAILSHLEELKREIKSIRKKLEASEPPYGSDAWWQWSDKKAIEDYKKGRYTKISSKRELDKFFDSLK